MARKEQLTLDNLRLLDFGKIGEAFNVELKRVVQDCNDRPTDKANRTVTIQFKIAPEVDVKAGVVHAEALLIGVDISSGVPKRQTQLYRMTPTQDGRVHFHPDLADEPEGNGLYDEHGEKADRRSV